MTKWPVVTTKMAKNKHERDFNSVRVCVCVCVYIYIYILRISDTIGQKLSLHVCHYYSANPDWSES